MGVVRLRRADAPRPAATIPELARELNALYRQWDRLTTFESFDVDARINGIEQEIADRPARGLTDAAVQLMIAAAYLESIEGLEGCERATQDKAMRLVHSALGAVAFGEGLALEDVGGTYYLAGLAGPKS